MDVNPITIDHSHLLYNKKEKNKNKNKINVIGLILKKNI